MTSGADLHNNMGHDDLGPLTREALRWVVRITSGEATLADARALAGWRARGPDYEAAFREAAAFRRIVRAMDLPSPTAAATVLPFRPRPAVDRRAVLAGGGAIAASVAAWMVMRPPLGLWPSLAEWAADDRTDVGERRHLTPLPGVAVELNGRSALSFADRGHGVRLIDGEAFIAVSGAQPGSFAMAAGRARLTTRAASLNISTNARQTCVTCLAGLVEHSGAGAGGLLRPGQQLIARADGTWRVAPVDPQIVASWRRGLLIFHDTPLADAVDAVNRYRAGRIILAGNALGRRPINGIFHTDQIADAVDQIQQLMHLGAAHLPGDVVVLA